MQRKSILFSFLGGLAKLMAGLLQHWPLLAVIAFFVSPVGPHIRWEYAYRDVYGVRSYISCDYMGSRGRITPYGPSDCPFIAWLDSREGRR